VDRPTAVFIVVNREFCTMMPASTYCRESCEEPLIAPPNTYTNSSRNMIGWTEKSISSNGLCLTWTSVRQASEQVCWTARSGPTRAGSWAAGAGVTVMAFTR
jgi:hypothetical protein